MLAFQEGAQLVIVQAHRTHDDAIDTAFFEQGKGLMIAQGDQFCVVGQHVVVMFQGHLFHAANQFGEEGIGDVGDGQTDDEAAVGGETARGTIGPVVQFFDGSQDFLARLRTDVVVVVNDARHRLGRNTGSAGNIR